MIRIATDFNLEPAGRYPSDGEFNGERFREEWLAPALLAGDKVLVDLDGAEGYGSSFLEEAFGGLARVHHITGSRLHDLIEFKSEDDDTLPVEIWGYVDVAAAKL